MSDQPVVVPDAWLNLDVGAFRGVLLIVGAPDTGKSTFAHWLFERLVQIGRPTAFLDGDVGQSTVGPPTTLALVPPQTSELSQNLECLRWFVGDVSPRGHMLPQVVGAGRLTRRALKEGAKGVVVDTTGLVERTHGGVALKHALVDQLQPTRLFAFQRSSELEPILAPLRHLSNLQVVELPVAGVVRRRGVETRRAYRAEAFRRYFAGAELYSMSLRGRGVFGGQTFAPGRLLALQNTTGFTLAIGAIAGWNRARDELTVRAPPIQANTITSIHLGAIGVDVDTGREFRPANRR
jgi:polynucleotide 5'-hydroxyl-kinase GRC3/NOL9